MSHTAVPSTGHPHKGGVYRRADLHERFAGNTQKGIIVSTREKVVLLFHTLEPSQQYYQDGLDDDGIYWYSGEGVTGDMHWTHANRSVANHRVEGRSLLLFERAQRSGGYWRFEGEMRYIAHKRETRRDKAGDERQAIVFALLPVGISRELMSQSKA